MSEHKHGERCYISSIRSELSDVRQFRAGGLNNRSGTVRGAVCGALDGRVFFLADAEVGVNYPPIHPNARCTTTAYFGDGAVEEAKRRARHPLTGEPVLVLRSMTYAEWVKMQKDTYTVDIDTERKRAYNEPIVPAKEV